jgi:hypothetical protein
MLIGIVLPKIQESKKPESPAIAERGAKSAVQRARCKERGAKSAVQRARCKARGAKRVEQRTWLKK